MLRSRSIAPLIIALACLAAPHASSGKPPVQFVTGALPAIPYPGGLAGVFAGVSGNTLILAGGQTSTQSGTAQFSDQVFLLPESGTAWEIQSRPLLQPAAFGASAVWNDAVLCIAGKNNAGCLRTVVRIQWNQGRLQQHRLPDLPQPAACAAAAVVQDTLYVAGGLAGDGTVLQTLWALPLSQTETPSWQTLQPCPGPARSSAVAAAQDNCFFLFGGRSGPPDSATELQDGYRFTPADGWTRLADPPCPVAGSPSPALPLGQAHLMLLPQKSGQLPAPQTRPILLYHTITNTWVEHQPQSPAPSQVPSPGTAGSGHAGTNCWPRHAPMIHWNQRAVIPGGNNAAGQPVSAVQWIEPRQALRGLGPVDWTCLALYLAAMVGVGVYFSRRQVHTRSYFLANQQIPWWAAGISIFATSISALTFMAIPALVYQRDWVYFLGNMMIVAIAPVIIYFYLPFYRRLEITSAYEYLEKRFGLAARLVGSGSFLLYQLGRMGVVVYLPALALSAVSGIDVYLCIVVMGVLATLYTVLGGIEAVIWTDFIQVIVLLGGALLSFGIIAGQIPGGLAGVVRMGIGEGKFHAVNLTWDVASASVWVVVLGNFFKFLIPYSSDQSVVQRYLTTTDERMAARSIWTNAWMSVPAWFVFFALGTALWAFFKTHPGELDPLSRNDEILPWFIVRELPTGLAGIVIAALFAAAMSSLDSGMNSMATAITTDFYQRFRPQASQRAGLRVARLSTAALGVAGTGFALYMAYLQSASVWNQFLKIMGLFGGGLGGLFLAGIFTRRTSSRGALVGFAASALALYWVQASGAVHFFLYGAVGMFTCLIAGWASSFVLPDRGKSLEGLTVFSLNRKTGSPADAKPEFDPPAR